MNILHVADKEMIGIYTRSFDWQVKIQVFCLCVVEKNWNRLH